MRVNVSGAVAALSHLDNERKSRNAPETPTEPCPHAVPPASEAREIGRQVARVTDGQGHHRPARNQTAMIAHREPSAARAPFGAHSRQLARHPLTEP